MTIDVYNPQEGMPDADNLPVSPYLYRMPVPLSSTRLNPADIRRAGSLFVFALQSEAAGEFNDCQTLITGIGKVNAAYTLTRAIPERRPELIVNLGSAGSNVFPHGDIVCCTKFIQRDMDITGLGYKKYETPFSAVDPVFRYGLVLEGLPEAVCGTGDSFEMNHLSSDYDVLDMEAYAIALIASREAIPLLCLKYISDGADGNAADDWTVRVHHAARAFRKILFPKD